ncbi:magnesium transporter CorA family protein [Acinetobacter larvae]|uniref:Magnesium transporter n=1 Tax=Acinetobacter larvae TaxID=1789224 RepID=A0A1B2M3T8_9GAMM|nr:magnesium transporter CorA family protein [Acinetobacter larvae]AOA59822.1 magnesium transporter [Acinetobacter larvae]
MQIYYFYQHRSAQYYFIQNTALTDQSAEFVWMDCVREDVVNQPMLWQQQVFAQTGLHVNELHVQDILNLEHPCTFDTLADYDLLIFRKLITQNDHILQVNNPSEQHASILALETSPVSFIITPQLLLTVREQGNQSLESYVSRVNTLLQRPIEQQNVPRKLASSPLDLALRLLNSMVDDYLQIRVPLTKRVDYWQQALLQDHRRFHKWNQLLQENMAFQQIENLCEEQIESLQELKDEVVDNFQHLKSQKGNERQDILLVRINDLSNHIERIQTHTTRFRNAIQSAIDLHFSAIANQTNENMRILAIITAIFAPLTLLTGLYGMNFEFIPGIRSPHGFWVMIVLMLLTTFLLISYFYRQHLVGRGERSVLELMAQQNQNQRMNFLWFMHLEPLKPNKKNKTKS